MSWLYIGMLLGSVVTSTHDTKEACLGREAVLKEKGVIGQCVNQNIGFTTTRGTGIGPGSSIIGPVCDSSGVCYNTK